MKLQIEIFTAGCPVCDPVVDLVKETADENSEIKVYDLVEQCDDKECLVKIKDYTIKRVPSIVVNGELLDCCKNNGITKEDLTAAGIGHN